MSGAHDQARDAAQKMLQALRHDEKYEMYENITASRILDFTDEIETIAEYLGVEEDQS